MNYEVCIISNDDLPAEVPWAFVRRGGRLEFWLRESTTVRADRLAAALTDAWRTYRRIERDELLSWSAVDVPAHAG